MHHAVMRDLTCCGIITGRWGPVDAPVIACFGDFQDTWRHDEKTGPVEILATAIKLAEKGENSRPERGRLGSWPMHFSLVLPCLSRWPNMV